MNLKTINYGESNDVLNDMQMENGITHTEIKLDKQNKPIIIESQVRIGGATSGRWWN